MGSAMVETSVADYGNVSALDADVVVSFQQRFYIIIFRRRFRRFAISFDVNVRYNRGYTFGFTEIYGIFQCQILHFVDVIGFHHYIICRLGNQQLSRDFGNAIFGRNFWSFGRRYFFTINHRRTKNQTCQNRRLSFSLRHNVDWWYDYNKFTKIQHRKL